MSCPMNDFLNIVITIWNEGVFGINFNNIALGIFILLLFVFFRSLFSKIVVSRLKAIASRSKTKIDDEVLEAFSDPIRFIPIVLGVYISTAYIDLNQSLELFAANLNKSLITILIFWFMYKLIDPLSFFMNKYEIIIAVGGNIKSNDGSHPVKVANRAIEYLKDYSIMILEKTGTP